MGEIWIEGGNPLEGEVWIQGSKNAALPMMAAALLHDGVTVLRNCPQISDVRVMEKILSSLGVEIHWEGDALVLNCRKITSCEIASEYAESMRSSVTLLGSMLSRLGEIHVAYPGGCTIGKRPIDLHMMALEAMGARITEEEGRLRAVRKKRMKGARIFFPISSVGATENAMLAAVKAEGTTVLENCAAEPEIVHLCHFLQAMGAEIGGIGTRRLWIRGVGTLRDVEYTVPPDRIAAGTYLYAAAATRGRVVIRNGPWEEMQEVLSIYEKMGGQWEQKDGKLRADARRICHPIPYLETACYPGFPTDLQSILTAVLLTVDGESRIRERIFENRFQVVPELCAMGGRIQVEGQEACIFGKEEHSLCGAVVEAKELRGGAALVVAALAAEGRTVIRNPHFIERGYEKLERRIAHLGGRMQIKEQVEK